MQGQRNPNASTCLKLASYYTIKNELFPKNNQPIANYSFAAPPVETSSTIDFDADTDFGRSVNGKSVDDVLNKLNEIMTGLYVINPPLYRKILRELADI